MVRASASAASRTRVAARCTSGWSDTDVLLRLRQRDVQVLLRGARGGLERVDGLARVRDFLARYGAA